MQVVFNRRMQELFFLIYYTILDPFPPIQIHFNIFSINNTHSLNVVLLCDSRIKGQNNFPFFFITLLFYLPASIFLYCTGLMNDPFLD